MNYRISWIFIAFLASGTITSTSIATTIVDDFQDDTAGMLPNTPWLDITQRIDVPTVLSPTGTIVNTIGPSGAATKAYQNSTSIGTSSGIIATISPADRHKLSADIRIDALPNPLTINNFNADMSLLQDTGIADFNFGPQATVFVSTDKWHLYVRNAGGFGGSIFVELSPTPVVLGAWYHVELLADTTTGVFEVNITSTDAGFSLNRTESFTGWNPALGQYDAIAFYDGEYEVPTNSGGQFTVDNVSYGVPAIPTMSAWGAGILALLLLSSASIILLRQ